MFDESTPFYTSFSSTAFPLPQSFCLFFSLLLSLKMLPMCLPLLYDLALLPSFSLTHLSLYLLSFPQPFPLLLIYLFVSFTTVGILQCLYLSWFALTPLLLPIRLLRYPLILTFYVIALFYILLPIMPLLALVFQMSLS